ncbi:hypothetical protein BGW42_008187 [Actinomortierella wolfii]|nr:hypothetical protein BGW42_008187 [Actinomortierella wolfii]
MSLTGPRNSLLAIFGGVTSDATPSPPNGNSLYTYDTNTKTWTAATLRDPPRRQQHSAVSKLGDGSMYFFGGTILSTSTNSSGTPTFELWALGRPILANSTTSTPGLTPRSSTWEQLESPSSSVVAGSSNIGTSRTGHTATLLRSSGLMVVIGGVMDNGVLASMSDILVYDIASGKWSVQIATGATPPPRTRHTAAATKDGLIYIHGGTDLGMTNYFADMAILGLTAGGAIDSVCVMDTTTNTWVSSYTPNNLDYTSTKPEDWPGYQPLPDLPGTNGTTPPTPGVGDDIERNRAPLLATILGSMLGVLCASLVVVAVVRHRRRKRNQKHSRPIDTSFYGAPYSASMWQELDRAYAPMGLAFERPPQSFQERVRQRFSAATTAVSGFWSQRIARGGGKGQGWGWKKNKKDRSHVFRILDRDADGSLRPRGPGTPSTAFHTGTDPMNETIPTDQELFLDAVKRARSRGAVDAPVFAPLQPPLSPTSPNKAVHFQFPPNNEHGDDGQGPVEYYGPGYSGSSNASHRLSAGAGSLASSSAYGSDQSHARVGGAGPYTDPLDPQYNQLHGRTYSDGFENSMAIMDVQMVSVPRGRLFVVNPSEEDLEQGDTESNDRRELEPLHKPEGESQSGDTR